MYELGYVERHIEGEIKDALGTFGAVVIDGPKWCGKTTTAKRFANSALMLSDPTNDFENKARAQLDPKLAITGKFPRLLDEWQEVPKLWDAVRFVADEAGDKGMFILTGSATPQDAQLPMHSGTGRFGHIQMDTMTSQELGISKEELSLSALFEEGDVKPFNSAYLGDLSAGNIAEMVVRGGWPGVIDLPTSKAKQVSEEYVQTICEIDVSKIDDVRRDPNKVRSLMFSLARNESTYASLNAITRDVSVSITRQTVAKYISLLQRMHICDNIPAWYPALRSPVKIREAKKLHFADVSLVAATLSADVDALLNDFKTLGHLFESLVLHDLKVYANMFGAKVYQYHDSSDLEVDAIVEKPNGVWLPIEIKLGAVQAEKASANLDKLVKKITVAGNKPPICKLVIYGFGTPSSAPDEGCIYAALDSLCA